MVAEHEDNSDHLRRSLLLFDRVMLGKPGAQIYYLGTDPAKSKEIFQRINTLRSQQFVDNWFAGKGLLLDSESRNRLLTAVGKAVWQARKHLALYAL